MVVSLVLDRTGKVLPAPIEDVVGAIGGRVEGAKGPSSNLDRESMVGGAAELVSGPVELPPYGIGVSCEQTCSPIWEMGISTLHCEHFIEGRKLEALVVTSAMLSCHCLFLSYLTIRPEECCLSGMRAGPRTRSSLVDEGKGL